MSLQHVSNGKQLQKAGHGRRVCLVTVSSASTSLVSTISRTITIRRTKASSVTAAERSLLDALRNARGRGASGLSPEQLEQLNKSVAVLEADGGVSGPTAFPERLDGRWRLIYTSRPGTASPVQRTFTGVDAFKVFQDIQLGDEFDAARVNNIVEFGKLGYLQVEAMASTDSRPIEGFIPRQEAGLAIFGKSENRPPAREDLRIDFQFDSAAFRFSFLPFPIPYPVPFRLLGDESKGWIDITYLSPDGSVRLSRGNKGTLFVLVKDLPLKEQLATALAEGDDEKVEMVIDQLALNSPTRAPARSSLTAGRWRLKWTRQAANTSALQKLGTAQAESFQIIDGETGTLENVVNFTPWLRLSAKAECEAASDVRTNVTINTGELALGPLKIPLPLGRRTDNNPGWVDWLYLDDEMRVTRGSRGSVFLHVKEPESITSS